MSDWQGRERLCPQCGTYHTACDICPSDYNEDDREIKAEMERERRKAEEDAETEADRFVGNQPQALNLGECSAQELDLKMANAFLLPLYHARYRALDQSADGQELWVRMLAVRAELASIERLAEKMNADALTQSRRAAKEGAKK